MKRCEWQSHCDVLGERSDGACKWGMCAPSFYLFGGEAEPAIFHQSNGKEKKAEYHRREQGWDNYL